MGRARKHAVTLGSKPTQFCVIMQAMKHLAFALLLAVSPTHVLAQDAADPSDITDGIDLLQDGARTLLRGLMGEVEPAMRDMAEQLKNWDFNGIGLEDLGQYHPPEKLPNGDILIRRKTPMDSPMDGEIEL